MKKRIMKLMAVLLTVAMTVSTNAVTVPALQTESMLTDIADDEVISAGDELLVEEPETEEVLATDTDLSSNDIDRVSDSEDEEENAETAVWNGYIPSEYLNYMDDDLVINESQIEEDINNSEEIPSNFQTDPAYLPPVRSQSPFGTCWTFSTMAPIEGYLLKHNLAQQSDLDLAERALCYFFYDLDGIDDPMQNTLEDVNIPMLPYNGKTDIYQLGGNVRFASFFLANWGVPLSENRAPYSELVKIGRNGDLTDRVHKGVDELDGSLCYDADYHVQDFRYIPKTDMEGIKRAIMENGIVSRSYYHDTGGKNSWGINFYNQRYAAYNSGTYHSGSANHAVSVIGWDDDYNADNFNSACRPSKNGAWLIRNSWGSDFGDGGYMWISYEDESLGDVVVFGAVENGVGLDTNYDNNYFYDGTAGTWKWGVSEGTIHASNVFRASSDEELKAVSIAVYSTDVNYSLQIYKGLTDPSDPKSGTPMLTTPITGQFGYSGYYTVDLGTAIKLDKGETFSVVFTLEGKTNTYAFTEASYVNGSVIGNIDKRWLEFKAHTEPGQSFFSNNGSSWTDMNVYGRCFRIHAFTDDAALNPAHDIEPINAEIFRSDTVDDYLGDLRAALDSKYGEGEGAKWNFTHPDQKLKASNDEPTVIVDVYSGEGESRVDDYIFMNVTDIYFESLKDIPNKAKVGEGPFELVTYTSYMGHLPEDSLSVEYVSSDADVVSISEDGAYAYITGAGVATISANLYMVPPDMPLDETDIPVMTEKRTITVEKDSGTAFIDGYVVSRDNDGKEVKTEFDKITDGYKINTTGGYRYYIEDKTSNASVSYTSTDTSIVQLGSMGADRRVEIVPKGPGYVNITGKVKGQNISRTIRLSVTEPYIAVGDTVLNFNPALTDSSAELDIFNGYTTSINKVEIVDKNRNVLTEFKADVIKGNSYDTARVTYTGPVSNKSVNGYVKITLNGIKESFYKPVKLVVKKVIPKITIKTLSKVDNLYSDPVYNAGVISVISDSGSIRSISLNDTKRNKGVFAYREYDDVADGENPEGAGDDDILTDDNREISLYVVRKSPADIPEGATVRDGNNKGTIEIWFDGYRDPVKKDISIGYMTGSLKATVSNKSVLTSGNKVMSGNEIRINVTNTTYKIPENYEIPTIKIRDKTGKDAGDRYMSEYRPEGVFVIKPKPGTALPASGEEISITITDAVHRNPLNIKKFKVTGIDKGKAGLKLSKSSVVMKYFNNKGIDKQLSFETGISFKDCAGLNDIISGSLSVNGVNDKSRAALTEGRLKIEYVKEDGVIKASFPSGNVPVPGSYKYMLTLSKAKSGFDKDISTTLTLNVKKAAIKVGGKVMGKADVINRDEFIEFIPKFTDMPENCGYTIETVDITEAGTKGSIDKYEIMFYPDSGLTLFRLKEDAKVSTAEKHIFVITYKIAVGDGTLSVKTGKVRIPVTQGKILMQTRGRKSYSSSVSVQKEEFRISAINSDGGSVKVSRIELTNPNKDFTFVEDNGKYYIRYVPNGDVKRGKSYTLKFKVTFKDQAVNKKPVILNYKVSVVK